MILPPLSMWLHIATPGHRRIRLWLPLFLLWLILLPLMLLVLVVAIVVDVVLFIVGKSYHYYTLLLYRTLQVLAATRGTVIRVHGQDTVVDVTIA